MRVLKSLRRAVLTLAKYWWQGMNTYVHHHLRAEEEALERYRDQARGWRASEKPETRRMPPQ